MSDFTNTLDSTLGFTSTELDTGVDFAEPIEATVLIYPVEMSSSVYFHPSGDLTNITISEGGFGEGGFGEGPFGGSGVVTVSSASTTWREISTP